MQDKESAGVREIFNTQAASICYLPNATILRFGQIEKFLERNLNCRSPIAFNPEQFISLR
jgi:hypothetical protein